MKNRKLSFRNGKKTFISILIFSGGDEGKILTFEVFYFLHFKIFRNFPLNMYERAVYKEVNLFEATSVGGK